MLKARDFAVVLRGFGNELFSEPWRSSQGASPNQQLTGGLLAGFSEPQAFTVEHIEQHTLPTPTAANLLDGGAPGHFFGVN
jgi:hypothetical protein